MRASASMSRKLLRVSLEHFAQFVPPLFLVLLYSHAPFLVAALWAVWQANNTRPPVLVRRVLEARRQHAQPRTNPAPTSALAQPRRTPRAPAHEPGDSFSRTQPLAPPPLNEKSRGSGAERRGLGTDDRERGRVRSWLHRLRCW